MSKVDSSSRQSSYIPCEPLCPSVLGIFRQRARRALKMNFIFKMPDAILTVHAAEAHR